MPAIQLSTVKAADRKGPSVSEISPLSGPRSQPARCGHRPSQDTGREEI